MKPLKFLFLSVLAGGLILTSCKKDDEPAPSNSTTTTDSNADDITSVQNDVNDLDKIIAEGYNSSVQRVSGACYTFEISGDTSSPVAGFENNYRKFTITFNGDCDSVTRTGKIIVYHTGTLKEKNYKDSVIFSGYSSAGRSISGYRVFSANSVLTDSSKYVVDIKMNFQAVLANGKTISWEGMKQRKHLNFKNNYFYHVAITGQGQGVNQDGDIITEEITSPLILKSGWLWAARIPVQGVVKYKNTNSGKTASIDFGNGAYDRRAVVTKPDGTTTVIFIR